MNPGASTTIAGMMTNGIIINKTVQIQNSLNNSTYSIKIYTGNFTTTNPYNDYYLNAYAEYLSLSLLT